LQLAAAATAAAVRRRALRDERAQIRELQLRVGLQLRQHRGVRVGEVPP